MIQDPKRDNQGLEEDGRGKTMFDTGKSSITVATRMSSKLGIRLLCVLLTALLVITMIPLNAFQDTKFAFGEESEEIAQTEEAQDDSEGAGEAGVPQAAAPEPTAAIGEINLTRDLLLPGTPTVEVVGLDANAPGGFVTPLATSGDYVTVTVNFSGFDNVTINAHFDGDWQNAIVTGANGSANFDVPVVEVAGVPTIDLINVTVLKNSMTYTFSGFDLDYGNVVGDTLNLTVPTTKLGVFGISSACRLGVTQFGSGWAYHVSPATVGEVNYFTLFDNGAAYVVTIDRDGYYPINITAEWPATHQTLVAAGATYQVYSTNFYRIAVPAGVEDVRLGSNSWANSTIVPTLDGDMLTLLRDYNNPQPAYIYFKYGGNDYNLNFMLDGSNPFDAKGLTVVNFPGMQGVTLEYYSPTIGWATYPGIFNDSTGLITLPSDVTSILVKKNGNTSQKDGIDLTANFITVIDIPVSTITVRGIAADCDLGLSQGDWIYGNGTPGSSPASPGNPNVFYVFDNGVDYTVQLWIPGFHIIELPGVAAGREIFFAPPTFLWVTVPDGIANVWMQSNDWISPRGANAGDRILLLADFWGVGGIQTANMTFDWRGNNYNVDFLLNGTNPFNFFGTVTYEGNGGELADNSTSYSDPNNPYLFFGVGNPYTEDVVVLDCDFGNPGYAFKGWIIDGDASGYLYQAGDIFPMTSTDVVLIAQWESVGQVITVNFPGVAGVTVQYYTFVAGWVTVGVADDTCTFTIPSNHAATSGPTTVRVTKGGVGAAGAMTYVFTDVQTTPSDDWSQLVLNQGPCTLDVPIITLRVFGVNADCNIGIRQADWVFGPPAPVAGGAQHLYKVFDNGRDYSAQLVKSGFHPIIFSPALRTFNPDVAEDELWLYIVEPFWNVTVPEGISTVRMQSNGWIVNPAQAGNVITLLADRANPRNASMTFFWRGTMYTHSFVLDFGMNPFNFISTITYDGNSGALADGSLSYQYPYLFFGPASPNNETVLAQDNDFDNPGFDFIGWNTEADGSGTTYAPGATLADLGNVTLYAQWEPVVSTIYYNITFVLDGGTYNGSTADWTIPVPAPSLLVEPAPAPTKDGYKFLGWKEVNGIIWNFDGHFVNGHNTLTAQWERVWTVEFVLDGGTYNGSTADWAVVVPSGSLLTEPAPPPTKDGYRFDGWKTAVSGTFWNFAGHYVNHHNTLIAQWTRIWIVTFDPNGGEYNGNPASWIVEAPAGSLLDEPTPQPTRDGYTFLGWMASYNYWDFSQNRVNYTNTLTAQWELDFIYQVAYMDNSNVYLGWTGVTWNQQIPVPADPVRPGYTFGGWFTQSGIEAVPGMTYAQLANGNPSVTMESVWAKWTPSTYNITYLPNGGFGYMLPTLATYNSNVTLRTNTFVNLGYSFVEWNTSPDGSGTGYDNRETFLYTIEGPLTLYAIWSVADYTITFNSNDGFGGTADQTVNFNTIVTLGQNSFNRPGWTFTGWSLFPSGFGLSIPDGQVFRYLIPGNLTLYAQWEPNNYVIIYDANGGTGTMANTLVTFNTNVALAPNGFARDGYAFSHWEDAAGGVYASGRTFDPYLLDSDLVLIAQWTPITYYIIYSANGGAGVMADTPAVFDAFVTLDPYLFALDGYIFVGWNTVADGSGMPFADGMNVLYNTVGNLTLYAQWALDTSGDDPGDGSGNGTGGGTDTGDGAGTTTTTTAVVAALATTTVATPATEEPAAETPVTTTITPTPTPTTPPTTPTQPIIDDPVAKDEVFAGSWALVNLLLAALGALMALILLVALVAGRNKDSGAGTKKRGPRNWAFGVISLVAGAGAVVLFILTQNMSAPMIMVDAWTIGHAGIFAATILSFALGMIKGKSGGQQALQGV